MSDRVAQVVIVAEDVVAATFLRRYLERLKTRVNQRGIRIVISPRGSGVAWVLGQYASEVKEQRRRTGPKSPNLAGLVVHVDADAQSVESRHRDLAKALAKGGQRPRDSSERIALAVPKRNIETWIHGLSGAADNPDEGYDYKQDSDSRVAPSVRERDRLRDSRIDPAAGRLHSLTRPNAPPPPPTLPSVAAAVPELRRLEA